MIIPAITYDHMAAFIASAKGEKARQEMVLNFENEQPIFLHYLRTIESQGEDVDIATIVSFYHMIKAALEIKEMES